MVLGDGEQNPGFLRGCRECRWTRSPRGGLDGGWGKAGGECVAGGGSITGGGGKAGGGGVGVGGPPRVSGGDNLKSQE